MKNQGLFSSKDKSKKLKCRLLQFLFGALGVKMDRYCRYFAINKNDQCSTYVRNLLAGSDKPDSAYV